MFFMWSSQAHNWPQRLVMQLMPKQLVGSIGGQYLKDSKTVVFHPNPCEALEAMSKVMSSGFAGCVHFNTGNTVTCDIKVLILLYTPEKKAFLGFVPNNQTGFVDRLRKVIQQKQNGVTGRQPGAVGPGGQQQMPAQQQQQHMTGQQQQQIQQQQQGQMVGGVMAGGGGGGMAGSGMSGGNMAVVGNMGGGNMAVGMGGNMPGQMQGNMAGGMQGGMQGGGMGGNMPGNMGGMGNAMQGNMAMNQSNVQNQGVPNLSAVPPGSQVIILIPNTSVLH